MNPERKKYFGLDKYEATHPVLPEHENLRLDSFVQLHMPTLSREFLKNKISKGDIVISGRTPPHKPSVKVHAGETVTITTHHSPLLEDERWRGNPIELTEEPVTVFEDEHLIVCMKPPFMITHPAGRHLFYCATVFYGSQHHKVIHSIHRLDRETSGLLLLGKNPEVAQKMSQHFENDLVKKCYFFIAKKNEKRTPFPFEANERLEATEGPPRGIVECHPETSNLGKEAKTSFHLVTENNDYVLALAFPETGRQHQIRAHAAHHGYPLVGDKMYNGDPGVFMRYKDNLSHPEDEDLMEIPRHALHALALKVPYPQQDYQFFQAPLPQDLTTWIKDKFPETYNDLEILLAKNLKDFLEN